LYTVEPLEKLSKTINLLKGVNMPRKTKDVRRKGKDKAREHFEKCGKYDGKSVRRIEAYLEKVKNKPTLGNPT